jgi:hypothetical protein
MAGRARRLPDAAVENGALWLVGAGSRRAGWCWGSNGDGHLCRTVGWTEAAAVARMSASGLERESMRRGSCRPRAYWQTFG